MTQASRRARLALSPTLSRKREWEEDPVRSPSPPRRSDQVPSPRGAGREGRGSGPRPSGRGDLLLRGLLGGGPLGALGLGLRLALFGLGFDLAALGLLVLFGGLR